MKHILKTVGIGVSLGAALLLIRPLLQISEEQFLWGCRIAGVVAVAGSVIINMVYHRIYIKRMRRIYPLLEEGRQDEYIEQLSTLLSKSRGRYLHNLFTINLSAGYADKREYEKALELLGSLDERRLRGVLKLVYHINVCVCCFYTDQTERAMGIYTGCRRQFDPCRGRKPYGDSIAVLDIFAALTAGDRDRAAELLRDAKEKWPDPRLQEDYLHFEKVLAEA